jgi:hypothetical protein
MSKPDATEATMPFYTVNLDPILEELGIPLIKSTRIEIDRYIQEILARLMRTAERCGPS